MSALLSLQKLRVNTVNVFVFFCVCVFFSAKLASDSGNRYYHMIDRECSFDFGVEDLHILSYLQLG